MRIRTAAMLLASVLLLTGCSKTTVVDSTPSDSTVSDAAVSPGGSQDADGKDAQGSQDSKAAQESSASDAFADSRTDAAASTDPAGQQITPHGGEDDQEGDYSTAGTLAGGEAVPQNAGDSADVKLHITVETVEITTDELAEQDYTVPLIINLDKNPGINYSEWGLKLDDRCTYTANTKGLDFSTVSYINDERHFLWTAWTSGAQIEDYDGTLLRLNVTVPRDAAPGTFYKIEYAQTSLADGTHIWSGGTENWVEQNTVGWTDGGVVIK